MRPFRGINVTGVMVGRRSFSGVCFLRPPLPSRDRRLGLGSATNEDDAALIRATLAAWFQKTNGRPCRREWSELAKLADFDR